MIGGWVMKGTPSMAFGDITPCQWIAVLSRQFVGDTDADLVAFGHPDLRTGHDAVVGVRLDQSCRA